ncbi:MAG: GNAT family N-acetyltransferase [Lachnospiraceae bacterium]|nr:GNAT family N-acetyltransferase [Lachnospiraceae bacterium]
MLKDYATDKPILETDRLLLRALTESDVPDLKEWLGKEEIYTYWGRKASKGEKDPELLFIDPRPWVKRKPSLDFRWGMLLKETNTVIGIMEVFDIQNERMGGYRVPIEPRLLELGLYDRGIERSN